VSFLASPYQWDQMESHPVGMSFRSGFCLLAVQSEARKVQNITTEGNWNKAIIHTYCNWTSGPSDLVKCPHCNCEDPYEWLYMKLILRLCLVL
jgi:hypothetical protein